MITPASMKSCSFVEQDGKEGFPFCGGLVAIVVISSHIAEIEETIRVHVFQVIETSTWIYRPKLWDVWHS